ncbi:hypothetical protein JG687_00001709 [Phytophthora cactorum]|uniref:RxLR effector protein n=1 Tax=Phytophthora cactorum TaxID=29920 RepID=A0A329SNL3_9STRA|nr:hypothetical protein Pcac1_g11917 [Phytophthora cactorum]KAG2810458.1 hypothetical protein PC111_g15654 [Phytophthora cactorum]KAG2844946.1 hypothetical protein PC112_g2034 [Phytophthora cactorum]KAG2867219.1 hypothetical protein PC113_g2156 [Phytophthora cactorum]KAG2909178.1 hypothetical protein PC115_g13344 [Phytophthora cactorum]
MRVLSFLIVLISAVSATTSVNAGAINIKIELDADHLPRVLAADHQHTQRSLRRHDFAEVAEIAEERAGLEKVDALITTMDDVVVMAGKLVPTWKSALNKVAEHSVLVKKTHREVSDCRGPEPSSPERVGES